MTQPSYRTASTVSGPSKAIFGLMAMVLVAYSGLSLYSMLTAKERFLSELRQEMHRLQDSGVEPSQSAAKSPRALLRSREPTVRWVAAKQLGRKGADGAVPALIQAMKDEAGTRRTCVMAKALGEIGSPKAIPALVDALDHPENRDLRVCAANALGKIGRPKAVRALLKKATDPKAASTDRVAAISALGNVAHPAALADLKEIARSEPNSNLQLLAARAVEQIKLLQQPQPASALAKALESNVPLPDRWVLRRLKDYWSHGAAETVRSFLAQGMATRQELVLAGALLLHHNAMEESTIKSLRDSPVKGERWLAQYARERKQQGRSSKRTDKTSSQEL